MPLVALSRGRWRKPVGGPSPVALMAAPARVAPGSRRGLPRQCPAEPAVHVRHGVEASLWIADPIDVVDPIERDATDDGDGLTALADRGGDAALDHHALAHEVDLQAALVHALDLGFEPGRRASTGDPLIEARIGVPATQVANDRLVAVVPVVRIPGKVPVDLSLQDGPVPRPSCRPLRPPAPRGERPACTAYDRSWLDHSGSFSRRDRRLVAPPS